MLEFELALATANSGKLAELRQAIKNIGLLSGVSITERATPAEILRALKEDGATYRDNAIQKATIAQRMFAAQGITQGINFAVLADDSGLEIEALDNFPGVLSARVASTDGERINLILQRLANSQATRPWKARFRSVVAVLKDQQISIGEGVLEGEIICEPRGQNGFGYDPIFLLPSLNKTLAELSPEELFQHSFRVRAAENALEKYLQT